MAPSALDKLIAKRTVIEGNLIRTDSKVNDHSLNPIPERLLEKYDESTTDDIKDLQQIQSEILLLCADTEVNDHNKKYFMLCDIADAIHNALHGIKSSLPHQSHSISTNSVVSSTKLPKLDIKPFDGTLTEWISFRDIFCNAIHSNQSVPKVQKLVYLKSLLRGEASRHIQSLILSDSNYDTAWAALHDRYQNDREILFSVLRRLTSQPNSSSSATALRQLIDVTKDCMRSMEILNLKPDKSCESLILYILVEKLDQASRQLWELSLSGTSVPPLASLFSFLEQRARALAASGQSKSYHKPAHREETKKVHAFHGHSNMKCRCCEGSFHPYYKCSKFLGLDLSNRYEFLKKHNCCFNCLNEGHSVKDCSNSHRCKRCNQRHHSMLHPVSNPEPKPNDSTTNESPRNHHMSNSNPCSQGLLVTAVTQIRGHDGQLHLCRGFLDSGSTSSFISESFFNQLGLKKRKSNVEVIGLSTTNLGTTKGVVTLQISPYFDKNVTIPIEALIIPKVTHSLPQKKYHPSNPSHLDSLRLADPYWYKPAAVDLLLGADVFWNLLGTNKIGGQTESPVAIESKLGWLVTGSLDNQSLQKKVEVHHVTEFSLDQQIQKFWEIENLPYETKMTPEEAICESHFSKTHNITSEGKFVVSLPIKSSEANVGSSYEIAHKRLLALERRLSKNNDHRDDYNKFMREYEDLGHMTEVTQSSAYSTKYPVFIPHHFVLKKESTTTKFRVVFDASAHTSNGYSLNESLLVGPTLQDNLVNIIHRFRLYPVAITADIAKMYRQILVSPGDRKLQHILWRESPSDPIKEFELNTVTYGTACAPYLAVKSLQTLAENNKSSCPSGPEIVKNHFYVDDFMNSYKTLTAAINSKNEIQYLCRKGGFDLRKWTSNSKSFLDTIPEESREKSVLFDVSIDPSIKALGVKWNTKSDEFQFHFTSQTKKRSQITKRTILSEISKLYDPSGWLAPVIIQAKIFMQELWKLKFTWDEELPPEIQNKWNSIGADIENVNQIRIPRCLIPYESTNLLLAGFSDASESAYAACVYLVSQSSIDTKVSLVASKTRVAPAKTISIPKLELCGAVLLIELLESTHKALNLPNMTVHAWTDSTIVLNWIRSPSSKWKVFVANRISTIQSSNLNVTWHHVRSEENPADCASRGMSAKDLYEFPLWWTGPKFLKQNIETSELPHNDEDEHIMASEAKSINPKCFSVQFDEALSMLHSYSDLTRLTRISAWCLRFIFNCHSKANRKSGPLTPIELDAALKIWILKVQAQAFSKEIKSLCSNHSLPRDSKLRNLHPFIDKERILRVGGRLRHSHMSDDQKHPVLLPYKSKLTTMIIQSTHIAHLHAGPSLTQSIIQRKYWIIKIKDAVRFYIRNCVPCVKSNPKPEQQLMGDLPSSRVNPSQAFATCGVDFAGPFNLKSGHGKRTTVVKSYLSLFVCFTTRAFHLELVSSLSTDAFLAALKRFISRRGLPSHIYSDCGTNFVGASKELKKLMTSSPHNEAVANYLSKNSIVWHFNPPGAPHFGGLWEAGVKSVKLHLNKILSDYRLTFEELSTVMCQVEACLNSRPLTPLSSDPNDLEVLTSGHFLIGRPLVALPEKDTMSIHQNRLSRWQLIQKIQQQFWKRWSSEYLTRLQQRPKWLNQHKNIEVNDLVLVKDSLPTQQWKLARVVEIHPGSDNIVRVVSLRTGDGVYKRPISKICLLPIVSNSNPTSDVL